MSEPEKQYFGLLAAVSEACDIQRELGCTAERAYEVQTERAAERLENLQAVEQAEAESNVIPFRRKH